MDLQVQKKDGTLEPFDRSKISAGIVNSGATPQQAESITSQVEAWASGVAQKGVVKSADIRVKVLELLKEVNPNIVAAFEGFQKPSA